VYKATNENHIPDKMQRRMGTSDTMKYSVRNILSSHLSYKTWISKLNSANINLLPILSTVGKGGLSVQTNNDVPGEHKVFPSLQTFVTRKLLYVEYKYIFFNIT